MDMLEDDAGPGLTPSLIHAVCVAKHFRARSASKWPCIASMDVLYVAGPGLAPLLNRAVSAAKHLPRMQCQQAAVHRQHGHLRDEGQGPERAAAEHLPQRKRLRE